MRSWISHAFDDDFLVGSFNPFEKCWSNWIISPNWGKIKNIWNHHPVFKHLSSSKDWQRKWTRSYGKSMSSAETSQGCVSSVASCSGQRWWDLWSSLSSHLSAVITAKTQHIVQQLALFTYNVNVYLWYIYTYNFICAQISVLVQKSESPCLIVHPIAKIVSWQSTGTVDSNGRPWLTSTRKNHQGLNNPNNLQVTEMPSRQWSRWSDGKVTMWPMYTHGLAEPHRNKTH